MATPVQISSLDFDDIKDDIKLFLQSQSEFTDFDFDGSGMSVILDILAYATHYLSLQSNMSFNEMFLDTATLRNTIISRAKEMNYIPSQKTAARATITVSLTDAGGPVNIVMPKGTKFTSLKDDQTYFFTTTQEEIIPAVGGGLYQGQIDISQGEFLQTDFLADSSIVDQKFIIQDENVDVSFLDVYVKQLGGSYELWRNELDLTQIAIEDKVWFYQESFDKLIEIYFGDGKIGASPVTGEDIRAEYLVTEGIMGNGITNFQLTDNVAGYAPSAYTIVVDQKSQQGTDEESIDTIKLLAPKSFEAQNRAVTVNDYRALIINQFPSIQTMNIWGGEDNIPVQYGKVFMAIKPQYGSELSPASKTAILDYIQRFNVVGIVAEIVDPEYIYANITSTVKYYGLSTTLDDGAMTALIQSELENYITSQSANFGDIIYYSDVVEFISSIEPSIEANITDFTISSRIVPTPFSSIGLVINYSNAIVPGSLTSTWTGQTGYTYTMTDDGAGLVSVYKDGFKTVANQGSIDYATGILTLSNFAPDIVANTTIDMQVTPEVYDLEPSRKTLIISGDLSGISVVNISNQQ